MSLIESFPPLATPNARLLILGSMPGVASLAAQRYYAHAHNQFWPIMASLLNFDLALPYAERCARLGEAGVAVWDVLQHCVRPGSLDANIDPASVVPNDFAGFFLNHPQISHIAFNGGMAAKIFRKHVRLAQEISFLQLPSTSPAHASLRPEAKQACWRAALGGLLQASSQSKSDRT